ncbi:helix-turn-helix domain-containing protein [Pseudomonas sp. MDT1-85]
MQCSPVLSQIGRHLLHRAMARGQHYPDHLAHSNQRLSEIAGVLGFSELSAFSRWFSRHFDCSPSTWRTRQSNL